MIASTKSASPRMSAEDRRRQIVEVAAELFSLRGFNGTLTKEIADRAGVSQAIIFRHFPNKEAIYSAILDHKVKQAAERIRERLRDAAGRKDDRAYFGALAFDLLDLYSKDPSLIRLLLFSALEAHDLSRMFYKTMSRQVRDHVREYIKQRIADGAFRQLDPLVSARAFLGMVVHHAQVVALYPFDDVKISNRQMAEYFVEVFLDGVRKSVDPRRAR
ncbi:MAG TPA: TetR/AcrR family transcriptional regulator [Blastocatellia bacterium]|nr:TetR/AcrR family transcriptional regulator [Blastocatellia bacterium]